MENRVREDTKHRTDFNSVLTLNKRGYFKTYAGFYTPNCNSKNSCYLMLVLQASHFIGATTNSLAGHSGWTPALFLVSSRGILLQ